MSNGPPERVGLDDDTTVLHGDSVPPEFAVYGSRRSAESATQPAAPQLLRVFIDCFECDTEYLRQNVQFVDYVRDRTVADVHVLVTTQGTGRRICLGREVHWARPVR